MGHTMEQAISAAEANRRFSRLLQEVRAGRSYVVTTHGKPIARLVPFSQPDKARQEARAALLRRLEGQTPSDIGPWTRDELNAR
jgi:prevent-host-death family protein